MSDSKDVVGGVEPDKPKRAPRTRKKVEGKPENVIESPSASAVGETPKTSARSSRQPQKIAVYSEKNMYWPGNGRVEKGYSIMTASTAKKWIDRGWIRQATPEEVASEYGISL